MDLNAQHQGKGIGHCILIPDETNSEYSLELIDYPT